MKKILNLFLPRNKEIHSILKELASKCRNMSLELEKFLEEYNKIERNSRKSNISIFKNMKLDAEKLHSDALNLLENSKDSKKELFIQLSESAMKSCKLVNAIATRFVVMGIERIDTWTPKMSKLLLAISIEMEECITHMKNPRIARQHCKKIFEMEIEMDGLFEESLSELFHFFKNSLDVMKYEEIYSLFEKCADKICSCAIIVARLEA